MRTDKEVVELIKEFNKGYFAQYQINNFLKEKGLIEEFEVGKYYVHYSKKTIITMYNGDAHGLLISGCGVFPMSNINCWIKLSDKEVEDALKREGLKKYKKGNKVKCLVHLDACIDEYDLNTIEFEHYSEGVQMWFGHICIFNKGKWAEIIEEEKDSLDKIAEDAGKLMDGFRCWIANKEVKPKSIEFEWNPSKEVRELLNKLMKEHEKQLEEEKECHLNHYDGLWSRILKEKSIEERLTALEKKEEVLSDYEYKIIWTGKKPLAQRVYEIEKKLNL